MTTTTIDRSIAQALLQEFEHELATTRRFLERIPEDKLTWRPHPKSMSTGELALHIAQVPSGVLDLSLQDDAEPPDLSTREAPRTVRDVLVALERSAEHVRRTLPAIDDGRMSEPFTLSHAGKVILSMPRAEFLRAIMFNHWYHHRGQLGVYLRLLGATVPSSYGPSGDESPLSDAVQQAETP